VVISLGDNMRVRWKVVLSVLIVAMVAGLYWPSLHYAVFFDDVVFFNHNGLNNIFLAGPNFELRWLPYFLTAWIDLIFDDKIFAQRIINVGLHLTTGFVLYALVKQVSDRAAPHRNNERAALAAALLFLLHPLAVYAVGYLIQRTIIMATLFGLLTLNTYFDGLVTRKKAYFVFSAFFYFLSVFSKEHAVLIPLAALALTPLAVPLSRQTWRQLILPFALYLPIAIWVVVQRLGLVGNVYEPFVNDLVNVVDLNVSPGMLWVLSAMTQAAMIFKYLGLALFPNPQWMSIDMRPPFAIELWQPEYLLAVLALGIYGITALVWLLKGGRRGLIGYSLLAFLLLFAVEFSTVKIQEPFVLYRSYLWIPVLFISIPALTYALPGNLFWIVTPAAAGIFAVASMDRLGSFSSSHALWDDAVKKLPYTLAPGSARVHTNRCQHNMRRGDLVTAIADCTHGLQVKPNFKLAYQHRALAYMKQGSTQKALADAQAMKHLYPQDVAGILLTGVIYQNAGQIDAAIENFEAGCKRNSITACVAGNELKAMRQR
jgi:protein O-mannosyl-transferase